jgi:hypothetical protein
MQSGMVAGESNGSEPIDLWSSRVGRITARQPQGATRQSDALERRVERTTKRAEREEDGEEEEKNKREGFECVLLLYGGEARERRQK